jgi:hypothetical protein
LLIFAIGLTSKKESRSDRIHAVRGIPITPHAKIVAATLVVEIVAEAAELPILKANASETRAAGHRRCHDFHNDSNAPFFVAKMGHLVAHPQKESLSFCHQRTLQNRP